LGLHLPTSQNEEVAVSIESMLVRQGAIVLRSEPGSRTIEVTYDVRARRCWRRLLGLKDKGLSRITLPS
jgi:hypothetical protein